MGNARTILISLDHLVAEIAAFPLVSTASLKRPLTALDLNVLGATKSLWRAAERYFVAHFPNTSLDELVALRNSSWFDAPGDADQIPLPTYLRNVARKFLARRGSVAEPKLPGSALGRVAREQKESHDPAARRAWRWLTFAMPGDLLLAALAEDGIGPARVNLLAATVETILSDSGYAETHLHYGAGLNFPTAWAAAVNLVGRTPDQNPGMKFNAFCSPGADHEEGRRLANWLVRGAITRYLLASFLVHRLPNESWTEFWDNRCLQLDELITPAHLDCLRTALFDLRQGEMKSLECKPNDRQLKASFTAMQRAYNQLTRASTVDRISRLDDIQQLDPLSAFFPANSFNGPTVQLQYLWSGFRYLDRRPADERFAELFWQAERIRCQVYRYCIQRPLTPGLTNFIRFYERKGAITKLLEDVEFESSGLLGGVGHGLASLEVRTSPARDRDSQLAMIRRIMGKLGEFRRIRPQDDGPPARTRDGRDRAQGWAEMECGLVLHFLKFRGKSSDEGSPKAFDAESHADPASAQNRSRYRWQRYRRDAERSAIAIAGAIEKDPELLYFLRGIDVCRDEPGVPTWVIAPLFELVHTRVTARIERARLEKGQEFPPLRTTVHVGEDFVHLASGLRYMDEAIEHLKLRCGDRIGHGLALGVDPHLWARKSPRLAMPREDRWFDLVWEREWHNHSGARFANDRKTYVEDEILRLSRVIFRGKVGDDAFRWTVNDAIELARRLYCTTSLRSIGYPNGMLNARPATELDRQFERYLTEPLVYRACRTVEWVCVEDEGDAVAELQRLVRQRYADTGITIEVNPVSNLLVGDLTEISTHPLWRLAPGLGNEFGPTLRICIGSDDPLPFVTTLPEEYQFLYDSLILAGRSHAEARSWLEDVRKVGLESRFTVR